MKDKKLNPDSIKLFSTFFVSLISMAVVFVMTGLITKRSLDYTKDLYVESCKQVLKGYANSVYYYLENYHTSLSTLYYDDLFMEGDLGKIHDWIIDNHKFVNDDFCYTFYYDVASKNGYGSDGNVVHFENKSYIDDADFSKTQYYISDLFFSEYIDCPVFVIEEPVYDLEGNLKAILCAVVRVWKLEDITYDIKIGPESSVSIVDRTGKFLVHPKRSMIGNTYVPANEKYRNISSDITAKSGASIVETEDVFGRIIELYSCPIQNSGWILSVAFPKSYFHKIYVQHNTSKNIIILVSLIILLILLFAEMRVTSIFYKKQLVITVYDSLTNLWTRQKFEEEAEKLLNMNPDRTFMLIESDIKGFKLFNSDFGEDTADKILYFYSTLLNKISTNWHGIIGRGYADHFYMLFKVREVTEAMTELQVQIELIMQEIKTYETPFYPRFGVTFVSPGKNHAVTVKALIGQASMAKNSLKDNMLLNYSIYNSHLLDTIQEERYMESRMDQALERGEFFIMYQPKIRLSSDKIVGAEALVRWKTPDMGIITPDKFIPLFERNGFIKKLDFYVYDKVFKFIESRVKNNLPVVPISVNMSRNHNRPDQFIQEFMEIFNKYQIPTNLIQVEILERSFMDKNTLAEITCKLHEKGFTVAMDDFGSGESSLNMLNTVPVDVLKFDREFLTSFFNEDGSLNQDSLKFIQILVDMGKTLQKETVFEGVETQAQRDFLRTIDCDQVQGFFYSKPLSEEDFVSFIELHS